MGLPVKPIIPAQLHPGISLQMPGRGMGHRGSGTVCHQKGHWEEGAWPPQAKTSRNIAPSLSPSERPSPQVSPPGWHTGLEPGQGFHPLSQLKILSK